MSLGNILPMGMTDEREFPNPTPASVGIKERSQIRERAREHQDETFSEVMHRWGKGTLHAGPGGKNIAQSQQQALAIAYNIAEDK